MYPITSILALVANRAFSNLPTRFATRHIGMRMGQCRMVWRINDRGRLVAASPLITPDCLIEWGKEGSRISGSGDLLNYLSTLWSGSDWPAIVSKMAGDRLAPSVLYAVESIPACRQRVAERYLVPAEEAAVRRNTIKKAVSRIMQLDRRTEHLLAREGKA